MNVKQTVAARDIATLILSINGIGSTASSLQVGNNGFLSAELPRDTLWKHVLLLVALYTAAQETDFCLDDFIEEIVKNIFLGIGNEILQVVFGCP